MTPQRVVKARMKRAEITRRRILTEKLAHVLCRLAGYDPDQQVQVTVLYGRPLTKPLWHQWRPTARAQLEAQGWLTETE